VFPGIVGYLLMLTGTLAVFLSTLHVQARFPRALTYLGTISYGLYVFHMFWLWFFSRVTGLHSAPMLQAGLALTLTLGTASLSYFLLEKPILRYKERFETVRTRPA
jgi:peptidoglycan/LPS O-acetylase OafA/YrhL